MTSLEIKIGELLKLEESQSDLFWQEQAILKQRNENAKKIIQLCQEVQALCITRKSH